MTRHECKAALRRGSPNKVDSTDSTTKSLSLLLSATVGCRLWNYAYGGQKAPVRMALGYPRSSHAG